MLQNVGHNLDTRYFGSLTNFGAQQKSGEGVPIITAPIDKVENLLGATVDKFVPENTQDEEEKKSNKKAIKAGSAVLVIGGLVAILNPKFLSKWSKNLKVAATKAGNSAKNKNNFWGKTLKFGERTLDKTSKFLNYSNNFNSVKDEGFKWLCSCKKSFKKITWKPLKKMLETIDKGFVKVMKATHGWITELFDKISKKTVIRKYGRVDKSMKTLNDALMQYRKRLTASEQAAFDAKLNEIKEKMRYFEQSKILSRLKNQEDLMSDLENKTIKKMKEYGGNAWDSVRHLNLDKERKDYFRKNMRFWAEDILAPTREKVSADGKKIVDSLIGDGQSKGAYNEIMELLEPHLKPEEKALFKELSAKTSIKLRSARHSECEEYFDKKRDLILGSAPTDVLTAVIGLIGSGIAIGAADNKDERMSRTVTGVFPVIAGLGVSFGMTAMLISGVKNLLTAAASTFVLSKAGSYVDKHYIQKTDEQNKEVNIA